jgi:hypothetical protein
MRIAIAFLIGISLAAEAYAEVIISDRDRDNYCRFYADQAVKDNDDNVKLGCGYKGPEWQSIFGAHYGWCMRLKADVLTNATDAQKTNRGAALTICFCHDYAREAVKAAKENVSLGCGLSGGRWGDHHASHYNWCRSLPPHSRAHIDEEQARIQDLQRCKQDKIQQGAKTSPPDAATTADPKAGRTLGKRKLQGTFSGTWDTQMLPGGSFSVTFDQQGNRVTGQFINGSVEGTLEGATALNFNITFQSSVKGSGRLTLMQGGKAFDGRFTLESDPGTVRAWKGTRR